MPALPSPLITPAELAALLAPGASPGAPAVLDVRWRLAGPSTRSDHDAGHVPGAVHLEVDAELAGPGRAGPGGTGGRHPLPGPDDLQAVLRRAGVREGGSVVVHDDGDGSVAARAWWLLRWAGLPDVRVLDGGIAAWVAAGLPLSTEVPEPAPGDVVVRPGGMPVLDAAAAGALPGRGVLLDARAEPRYRGEVEPVDPVAGHVPGARSAPTSGNVRADGRFKDAEALRERFAALGATPGTAVGAYCGSGVTAAQEVLALELAGIPAALYPGSWSEWVADPSRPVATGPNP